MIDDEHTSSVAGCVPVGWLPGPVEAHHVCAALDEAGIGWRLRQANMENEGYTALGWAQVYGELGRDQEARGIVVRVLEELEAEAARAVPCPECGLLLPEAGVPCPACAAAGSAPPRVYLGRSSSLSTRK